ncbi:MAG: SH3 domain-containing protein [Saprospiraceae bacterium]
MKTFPNSNLFICLTFLLAFVMVFSCETETKKSDNSTSNASADEAAIVEEKIPTNYESIQSLKNLKTKDLIYPWVDKLNVRANASLKGKAIASVDSNAALEFTGTKSGDVETIVLRGIAYEDLWYKVITSDGKEGWVFGGAVRRKGESKGNDPITDTKFTFPHFGSFDLSTWKKIETKIEGEEVDYEITTYQKDNQTLEVTSSDVGEMHYGYDYKLKDKNGKIIKERFFSFTGDGKMLEEKVKDYKTNLEYTRKQVLKKHWYQLNDKPMMVNGSWIKKGGSSNISNSETNISQIKEWFQDTESNLKSYTKKIVTLDSEGGYSELIGYYDKNGTPKKIIQEEAMGHGAFGISHYLNDGIVYFVFEQRTSEASVRGPFTFYEKRIYLKDGDVIRLLEKEKTVKDFGEVDMSKVPNKDITATLKNKSGQIYFDETDKILKLLAVE